MAGSTQSPRPYPAPLHRAIRGYTIDPSLTQSLRTATLGEITMQVPWESLEPGPRGEYLEVIDHDPSMQCFYQPVDLDNPLLLAQDGLPPSEGTPQFHQQMVYAVASTTIERFEQALGRRALWRPGPPLRGRGPKDDSHFVQRLRIYPHALRDANAYYSPQKIGLLFGYFAAAEEDSGEHVPGGMVFTCLSHDIVAHETTHALLDGMHRRLLQATNPDMLAFHEAFADIVALFQHFTVPEILAREIANTRGDIQSQQNLLGQLAGEFGRATGLRGALRDAIGEVDPATGRWKRHLPDPSELAKTMEPHARGALLVAAVFDAFLNIYGVRTADLLRLSTGGTGILPAGAIHPDLVNRLAGEAKKSAEHVLIMCVRALDYCPPMDLTFGEYLRALITADLDLHPEDNRDYRVAFIEAFRQRGIYPRDVRALSVDNVRWRRVEEDEIQPSKALIASLGGLRQYADWWLKAESRRDLFDNERKARLQLHAALKRHFTRARDGRHDAAFFGLDPGHGFEVHAAHFAVHMGMDGHPRYQLIVQLTQERANGSRGAGPGTGFFGGSTLIMDVKREQIDYCVRKSIGSTTRMARQEAYLREVRGQTLQEAYLGSRPPGSSPEPFALLHRGY